MFFALLQNIHILETLRSTTDDMMMTTRKCGIENRVKKKMKTANAIFEIGVKVLNYIAKGVRFITVPPIVVTAELVLLLFFADIFPQMLDFWLALICLAVVPSLAYPLQKLVPAWRQKGQRMQRRLAFILSPVGYTASVICNILRGAIPNLLYISAVYLASVVMLTVVNQFTPWHASGHGCVLCGSVFLPCLFMGWIALIPGAVFFAIAFWASVYLKRHTVREFLLGACCSAFYAIVCYFLIHPTF